MNPEDAFQRYQDLQAYVGWDEDAPHRIAAIGPLLDPCLPALVDDFYAEIDRHPRARKVITGGAAQVQRLKGTLLAWLRELLAGGYDQDYVARRWRVGWRHVEIGLDQVFTNVSLSRLRTGLCNALRARWQGSPDDLYATTRALNQLIDLDLALIEDAYQSEYGSRMQRGERLAAIGQMAGGVAHELRNPLNVIKTSVYYLLNARNPTPQKKAEHLGRIERQVTLADGVITALSNFARLPVPNRAPFSVARCIQEALETDAMPSGCRLTVDVPESLPPALADAEQVRIVFANLLRNAREAMPQGGEVVIRARADGPAIEVAIRDTGGGISPANLGRIMEPLYSTKARGLGLGLALAKSILEKNEGRLTAASEPGLGSTFTVRLCADLSPEENGR
jgi:signal transduction histidine kinase